MPRNVEEMLAQWGIAGDIHSQRINRTRGSRHWRWYLDEMYVKLNGELVYLWRAVDHEGGEVLESYVIKAKARRRR